MNGPLTSCDTFAALGAATKDGGVVFAKNSDRPDDEEQRYVLLAPETHAADAKVRVQYLEIPQAANTHRVVGAQPLWLWGFEHGINEWGLAIGNEAIYTRAEAKEIGLLGMDLVRIALERARTASEAVDLIGALIEEYGIGGSAREHAHYHYDNGFLLCDPTEVWHLETAGYHWAARRVVEDVQAISNEPSIGSSWDRASSGIGAYLKTLAADGVKDPLNFADTLLDRTRPRGQATCRRARGEELLTQGAGELATEHLLALLRDHYDGTPLAAWDPADLDIKSICMHSTPYHQVKTAGSMVAHLREEGSESLIWLAIGQPCRRVFLPYRLAELSTQAELDATAELEGTLESLLAGKSVSARDELIQGFRKVEGQMIAAVRDGVQSVANIRLDALAELHAAVSSA